MEVRASKPADTCDICEDASNVVLPGRALSDNFVLANYSLDCPAAAAAATAAVMLLMQWHISHGECSVPSGNCTYRLAAFL
eukprot:scaffold31531_cov66-Phaeocystis_antarctica.AAC.5